jgi:3-deoxy-D-manno-octulosonic-acid transferase
MSRFYWLDLRIAFQRSGWPYRAIRTHYHHFCCENFSRRRLLATYPFPKWESRRPGRTIPISPMNLIYSAVMAVALLLTLPYWVLQMFRSGKYRAGLAARLGRVPSHLRPEGRPVIWVHAVSVGEVLAASGVIRELRSRYPEHRVVVSTTTATGQKLARQRFGDDSVFYFPLDFVFALRPYFVALHPELIVVAETELWPNFFRLAHRYNAHLAIINARISDRSFPRYRLVSRLLDPVLGCVDLFLAQSREDAGRMVAMGADPDRVEATGNLKFDIPPGSDSPLVIQLRRAVPKPVIVCGSTVDGEEPLVLDAFRRLLRRYPDALLILAPRHPERFAAVAGLVAGSGLAFWKRSAWTGEAVAGGVFLLDTIGELADLYQLATIAFVGGSLVPRGGHNILEAARFGVPIVVGPYTANFRDIMRAFERSHAVLTADPADLAAAFEQLLNDPSKRADLGARARETWRANAGATARTLAHLETLLPRNLAALPHRGNA